MMKVPLAETPTHPDYLYNCAQTALWNLCLVLKPSYILDIGTWEGTSALLAAEYLEKHQDARGTVITADVVTHVATFQHSLVDKIQVYPHTTLGLGQYPWAAERFLRPDWKWGLDDSITLNANLMLEALRLRGGQAFDLAYVDGDHSEEGLRRDLEIVKMVTTRPHYALLDDVYMPGVPAAKLYQEELRNRYAHYDFDGDGWEMWIGPRPSVRAMPRMALVWEVE